MPVKPDFDPTSIPEGWLHPKDYVAEARDSWEQRARAAGIKNVGLETSGALPARVELVSRCARIAGFTLLMPKGEARIHEETYAFFDSEHCKRAEFSGAIDQAVAWLRHAFESEAIASELSEPRAANAGAKRI